MAHNLSLLTWSLNFANSVYIFSSWCDLQLPSIHCWTTMHHGIGNIGIVLCSAKFLSHCSWVSKFSWLSEGYSLFVFFFFLLYLPNLQISADITNKPEEPKTGNVAGGNVVYLHNINLTCSSSRHKYSHALLATSLTYHLFIIGAGLCHDFLGTSGRWLDWNEYWLSGMHLHYLPTLFSWERRVFSVSDHQKMEKINGKGLLTLT